MNGHQRIKIHGLIWMTNHQKVHQFQQPDSQYPFPPLMTFFQSSVQELIMVINSIFFVCFFGVDIYLPLIFVDFLFEPDKYFLSTKLNYFVLQVVDFTLVGFWPKMYLVGGGVTAFCQETSELLNSFLVFSAKCD